MHYRDNSLYSMYADQPECPLARSAGDRLISLPLHLQLTRDDVVRICQALRDAVRATS